MAITKKKKANKLPRPSTHWCYAIVDSSGKYRYVSGTGIPELFAKRREAISQNINGLNGDRVVSVQLRVI